MTIKASEVRPKKGASNPEKEYFEREELEKIRRLREKLDVQRADQQREQEKALHWMRCPRCGGKMTARPFRDLMVDVCGTCGYIGLEKGELELLLHGTSNVVGSIVRAFRDSFHNEPVPGPKKKK